MTTTATTTFRTALEQEARDRNVPPSTILTELIGELDAEECWLVACAVSQRTNDLTAEGAGRVISYGNRARAIAEIEADYQARLAEARAAKE